MRKFLKLLLFAILAFLAIYFIAIPLISWLWNKILGIIGAIIFGTIFLVALDNH